MDTNATTTDPVTSPNDGVLFGFGSQGYAFGPGHQTARCSSASLDVDRTQSAASVTDTNFHHVAVTKSGSSVIFYLDGAASAVPAYNSTFEFSTMAAVGARGDTLQDSFLGVIDEMTIYNRALTPAEIASLAAVGAGGKCPVSGGGGSLIAPEVVPGAPQFQSISRAGGNVAFVWTAVSGRKYQVQYKTNLTDQNWLDLGGPITATNSRVTANDVVGPNAQRYYRIMMQPYRAKPF